jgi:NAD+--asparagine ADP-ribosyltransferase
LLPTICFLLIQLLSKYTETNIKYVFQILYKIGIKGKKTKRMMHSLFG